MPGRMRTAEYCPSRVLHPSTQPHTDPANSHTISETCKSGVSEFRAYTPCWSKKHQWAAAAVRSTAAVHKGRYKAHWSARDT
eukprot:9224-Heterococcus_DN1.PRE.1